MIHSKCVPVAGSHPPGISVFQGRHTETLGSTTVPKRPPRWPSGKASASKAADLGSIPVLAVNLCPRQVFPATSKSVLQRLQPPRWPSGKASTSRAEDPGFESRLRRDFFFGVESYQ